MGSFFAELKRRKVPRAAVTYLVAAWGLSVGAAELLPLLGAEEWVVRAIVFVAVAGFPVILILAWMFELTPEGLLREQPKPDSDDPALNPLANVPGADSTTAIVDSSKNRLWVNWERGGQQHRESFVRAFTIGRDPASDVHVDHRAVSRRHAIVLRDAGRWVIEDIGSRNGVYIDGEQLTGKRQLVQSVEIWLSPDGPSLQVELPTDATGHTTQVVGPKKASNRAS